MVDLEAARIAAASISYSLLDGDRAYELVDALCAELEAERAELAALRPVVEAATEWINADRDWDAAFDSHIHEPKVEQLEAFDTRLNKAGKALTAAVDAYRAQHPATTGDGGTDG